MMRRASHLTGIAFALAMSWAGLGGSLAVAAEFPYQFEPILSLTGDCQPAGAPVDPVPDPGCPGGTHPPSGRFNEPRSVAIDAYGNEYVASYAFDGAKGRIDVFDDEGNYITELADPFGPLGIAVDGKGNLYVSEQKPGTEPEVVRYPPSVYKPEAGEIKYDNPRVLVAANVKIRNGVAVDFSNDHLYVAQGNQIAEYSSTAEGSKLLNTITDEALRQSTWVAVDAQRRRLFASYCSNSIFDCGVLVFNADAPHELLKVIDGGNTPEGKFLSQKGWLSTAVDEESGHFFVDDLEASQRVYEFDENFEYFATLENEGFQGGNPLQIALSNSPLNKSARTLTYLFVPAIFAAGRVLAFEPPAITVPQLGNLTVTNIGETEAELLATIDPNGGDTEYVIEIEGPGIEGAEVVAQGMVLGSSLPKHVSGLVNNLEPGATYSVRIHLENVAGDDEEEILFATFSDALIVDPGPCPNQALRNGPSTVLPDCRAYELVTPADTNGRPTRGAGFEGDRFGMMQSSPGGGAVSFEITGGILPGTEGTGGFHGDPYRTVRGVSGWSTALVGLTGTETSQPRPGSVSPDQGFSFQLADGIGSAVIDDRETHYVRYPDGHKELVGRGSLGTAPLANGKLITEGGTHIVFQTTNFLAPAVKLEENAPATGIPAVYDRTADEVTHVVSLLPGDVTPSKESFYRGASPDGAGIAFENEGTIYLRLNNATTFQIGAKGAKFAGVSEEGKRVFYVEGGDLKAFDTEEEKVIDFTEVGDAVPVNVAPQGTRAYFVSEEAIAGSGPNPNGDEPQAGEQNLYGSEEGTISFVATITERDVKGIETSSGKIDGLGLWTQAVGLRPATDPSRLTPDGSTLLFQSRANLDGYDSGEFPQVYRYDSGAEELECISCPPTKLPASGGAVLQSFSITDLAAPFSQYGFIPDIRADGKRIFFESTEALVSSDTDEVRDVYEWEEEGAGSCNREGGCVYLISSGHSARGNYLFGHSASGDDVFFTTGDVLVGGEEDSISVYDARVGGGFPELRGDPCFEVGAPCPLPTPPPSLTVPKSDVGTSSNVTPIRCPRGKRKAVRGNQIVCVKKKHRKRHRHHHRNAATRR